jgi:acetyltransferase-like isoleucine patch superfamily enzyme
MWFFQKVLGFNQKVYWPVHFTSRVVGVQNIVIGVGSNPGYNPGIYIQGTGKLYIGNYVNIAQNTGILSGSHDIYDLRTLIESETRIGDYCWIGFNCTILPGVVLGNNTTVAANSVVTKSFPEGNCLIGGVPAKLIKELDPEKFVNYVYPHEYVGYMKKEKFPQFRKKNLSI